MMTRYWIRKLFSHNQRPTRTANRLSNVQLLEDRTTPAGVGPRMAISYTEVSAFIHSDRPLETLSQWVQANNVTSVKLTASYEILQNAELGSGLVSVAIEPGTDPLVFISELETASFVTWAAPNYIYPGDGRDFTPNDPSYSSQYHHTKMQTNLAWDVETGESSIIVAVTDDGVAINHADLAANIWTNPGEIAANGKDDDSNGFIDDVHGWDFSGGDNSPLPNGADTHGTHVSGIVGAISDNKVGVAGVAGGGNGKGGGVRIMPVRWDGTTAWTSQRVAESFTYAANNGAKIVNSSYNFDGFVSDSTVLTAWDYSYGKGVLHFNSAGNNNTLDPARKVLTYALFVANTDSNDKRASSSNYGAFVDVSAPGTSIFSTTTSSSGTTTKYGNMSGTSMASPNAAAVAALIWSNNPSWTREQVVARLLATTDPIDSLNVGFEGKLGTGRVNSNKAMTIVNSAPKFGSNTLPDEGSMLETFPTTWSIVTPMRFLPTTVTSSSFELRRDGPDGIFNTFDDVTYPLTINAGAPYRVGTNEFTFTFTGSPTPDRYRFRAISGGLRDPFFNALDGNGDGAGGDHFDRTFTLNGTSGVIYGTVFEDRNGDQSRGLSENGLAGWTVYADANNDSSFTNGELSATTNSNGLYALSGLPAGTSIIRRVTPTGWNDGTPSVHAVTLAATDSVVYGRDFGQFMEGMIYGQVFSDVSNEGRRTGGEAGLIGWTGFVDYNNNGVVDSGSLSASIDVPKSIVDFTTVNSLLTISGFAGTVFDVNVQLDIAHTYDADLDIYLYAPGGQKVELTTDVGLNVANFTGTIFDDQALVNILGAMAPYTGNFQAEGSLSAFNGLNPNGTWKLEISDDANSDTGTLNGWKIILNADPTVTTDAAGTFRLPTYPGTHNVRRVVQSGWTSTAPAEVFPVILNSGGHVAGLSFGQRSNTLMTGSVYVDDNASGSFGFGEHTSAGRIVYVDNNGNNLRDTGVGKFVSPDVPMDIRDFMTTHSIQDVSGLNGIITDVNVTLDITHTYDADLYLYLIGPDGTRIELSISNGQSFDNYTNTTFDDQAATPINLGSAPFTGSFKPQGLLSDFNGGIANGTWRLEVRDSGTSDIGTVNSWSLEITTSELTSITDSNGLYNFGNQTPGTFAIRTERPLGWISSEPIGEIHNVTVSAGQSTLRNFGQYQPVNISGRVYNDDNGSYRLDIGETGVPGAIVFLDTNNDGVINSATTTFNSTDVPKAIPDDAKVISTLNVSGFNGVVADINIKLSLSHTWDADLDIYLVSPTGQRVELTTDNGGSASNYTDTIFDDEAATGIVEGTAPFTGTFRPEGLLSDFDLSVANGLWTLEIIDDAFQDIGTLHSWSLTITGGEAITTSDANGNYEFDDLPPGSFTVRQILPGGLTQTQPGGAGNGHVIVATSGTTSIDRNLGRYVSSTIAGTVYVDANQNHSKDGGESGIPGVNVYLDANDNGIRDTFTAKTFNAADVPLNILDGGTTVSKVAVSGLSGVVHDVNVKLNLNHTYDADLQIVLISPSGQRIALALNNGFSGDNFIDTIFDDEASTSITSAFAPFTGSFRPVGSLSAADGFDPNGDWYLEVRDMAAIDIGTLNSWSISIATGEQSAVTDAAGNYSFTLGAGTRRVRTESPVNMGQTEPTSNSSYVLNVVAGDNLTNKNFGFTDLAKVAPGGIVINGGDVQRSRVTTMKVIFDRNVGTPSAASFKLQNQTTLLMPAVNAVVDNSGASTVVTLTFAGASVESGSLADGKYTLTISANAINGGSFDGNGDGKSGDDFVLTGSLSNGLFRLFGDADGNATVNAADFAAFRSVFGLSGPSIFDFNNDGLTNAADFAQFRARFGIALTP